MPYLNKNAILSSLTQEDVIKIVTSLGSNPPRQDNNGVLIFQTICHNPPNFNNSYKLYYYPPNEKDGEKSYGIFHCYSGCSESFSIIELVIRAKRQQGKTLTWYNALLYIATITDKTVYKSQEANKENKIIDDFNWINKIKNTIKDHKNVPNLKEINPNILQTFCYNPHEDWINDNISREALSRYGIGYYGYSNQIVIPHYDMQDRLIGIRGRFLDEEDIVNFKGKYMPLMYNEKFLTHSLGNNLYGINVAQDNIKKNGKCILFESEKSCLQTYSYFEESSYALAVCGHNITTNQAKILINSLGVNEVQIAFDKEYDDYTSFEAQAYYNLLVKKVSKLVPFTKVFFVMDRQNLLNRKDSPSDKGKEILLKLLDDKILITTDEVKRVIDEENANKRYG